MEPEKYFKILTKPNPEFAGYFWHDSDTDPTAWFIELFPDGSGKTGLLQYAVLWYGDMGNLKCQWEYTGAEVYDIGIIMFNYKTKEFEFMQGNWYPFLFIKGDKKKQCLANWLNDSKKGIEMISTELVAKHFPTKDEYDELFPNGSAILPPIG